MSTLVTIVRYHDETPHPFVHPSEERIRQLLDGALDHFPTRRYLPHALVVDGDTLAIDEDVSLSDAALRERLKDHDLRLVECNEIEEHHVHTDECCDGAGPDASLVCGEGS